MPTLIDHTNIDDVVKFLDKNILPLDHDEILDIKFLTDLLKISNRHPEKQHARFLYHYLANIIDALIERIDGLRPEQKMVFNTCIEAIRDSEDALGNVSLENPPTADNTEVVLKMSALIAEWYKDTTGKDPKEEATEDAEASAEK